MPGLVQLRTVRAQPLVAGGLRLTPESQALTVRLPFGGLAWQRPTAVVVDHGGQTIQRLPIIDFTRIALVAVCLGTLLVSAVCVILSSRQRES